MDPVGKCIFICDRNKKKASRSQLKVRGKGSILQGYHWRARKKMKTNAGSLFWSSSLMGNGKSTSEILLCFRRWSSRISNQFLARKLESFHTRFPFSLTVREIMIIHGNSLKPHIDQLLILIITAIIILCNSSRSWRTDWILREHSEGFRTWRFSIFWDVQNKF